MTESLEKKKLQQAAPKRTNVLYDSLTSPHGPIVGIGQMKKGFNMKTHGAFVGVVLIGSLSVGFIVSFKNYHASLEKMESLNELFKNPNARVAAGKQGKKLVKKLSKAQESEKKTIAKKSEKDIELKSTSSTLNKVKQLLEAKKKL